MRISDWSSDVCSSDLKARQERLAEIDRAGRTDLEALLGALLLPIIEVLPPDERRSFAKFMLSLLTLDDAEHPFLRSIEQSPATFELNRRIAALFSELGRASCRERVCTYV